MSARRKDKGYMALVRPTVERLLGNLEVILLTCMAEEQEGEDELEMQESSGWCYNKNNNNWLQHPGNGVLGAVLRARL